MKYSSEFLDLLHSHKSMCMNSYIINLNYMIISMGLNSITRIVGTMGE